MCEAVLGRDDESKEVAPVASSEGLRGVAAKGGSVLLMLRSGRLLCASLAERMRLWSHAVKIDNFRQQCTAVRVSVNMMRHLLSLTGDGDSCWAAAGTWSSPTC